LKLLKKDLHISIQEMMYVKSLPLLFLATIGIVHAGLLGYGPIHPLGKVPRYYVDSSSLVLDICRPNANDPGQLQQSACLLVNPPPPLPQTIPDPPYSFPTAYPDEQFYFRGVSKITDTAVDLTLGVGLEHAFANGAVIDGDQIIFARTRVFGRVLSPGDYVFTHPYGTHTVTVTEADALAVPDRLKYRVNWVVDIGLTALDFGLALTGSVDPFLYATNADGTRADYVNINNDDFLADAALGDTTYGGSPFNTNYFEVVGPNGVSRTDLMQLTGKVRNPRPVGNADTAQVYLDQNTATTIRVLDNDFLDEDLGTSPATITPTPAGVNVQDLVKGTWDLNTLAVSPLTANGVSLPAGAEGKIFVDKLTGVIQYTPPFVADINSYPDQYTVTFTYTISKVKIAHSTITRSTVPTTVTVTVVRPTVVPTPTAVNDNFPNALYGTISLDVLKNDVTNGGVINPLSVVWTPDVANPSTDQPQWNAAQNVFTLTVSGSFTTSLTYKYTYTVKNLAPVDGSQISLPSNAATVVVNVYNPAPTVKPATYTCFKGTTSTHLISDLITSTNGGTLDNPSLKFTINPIINPTNPPPPTFVAPSSFSYICTSLGTFTYNYAIANVASQPSTSTVAYTVVNPTATAIADTFVIRGQSNVFDPLFGSAETGGSADSANGGSFNFATLKLITATVPGLTVDAVEGVFLYTVSSPPQTTKPGGAYSITNQNSVTPSTATFTTSLLPTLPVDGLTVGLPLKCTETRNTASGFVSSSWTSIVGSLTSTQTITNTIEFYPGYPSNRPATSQTTKALPTVKVVQSKNKFSITVPTSVPCTRYATFKSKRVDGSVVSIHTVPVSVSILVK
jgi:hypothetical protein